MWGTVLDVLIVAFVILQIVMGWRRGLLWHVAGTISMIAAIIVGLAAAPFLGRHLLSHFTHDPFHAKLSSFILVAGIVGLIFRVWCAYTEAKAEKDLSEEERELRKSKDKAWGGLFGLVKGTVIAVVLLAGAASFWPDMACWKQSRLAQPLAFRGAKLFPKGTEQYLRSWMNDSAEDLQEGLDIQTLNKPGVNSAE